MSASAETVDVIEGGGPARPDFVVLFRAEAKFVWNTLRRLGVRRDDLEDVTHEVFLAVHRHYESYDPSRPIRPYLFGFAYRIARRYRDLARHRVEVLGDEHDAEDAQPNAEQRLASAQMQRMLDRALEGLSLDQRAVFVMHDVEQMGMPEIAEALSIPLNTAYSRLRLARGAVREGIALAQKRLKQAGGAR